jgi:hypothetical protein
MHLGLTFGAREEDLPPRGQVVVRVEGMDDHKEEEEEGEEEEERFLPVPWSRHLFCMGGLLLLLRCCCCCFLPQVVSCLSCMLLRVVRSVYLAAAAMTEMGSLCFCMCM